MGGKGTGGWRSCSCGNLWVAQVLVGGAVVPVVTCGWQRYWWVEQLFLWSPVGGRGTGGWSSCAGCTAPPTQPDHKGTTFQYTHLQKNVLDSGKSIA